MRVGRRRPGRRVQGPWEQGVEGGVNNDGERLSWQEISVLFTLATRTLKHHESEQGHRSFCSGRGDAVSMSQAWIPQAVPLAPPPRAALPFGK